MNWNWCMGLPFCCPLDKERMDSVGDCGEEKSSIVRIFGHDVTDFSSQYGAETRLSYVAANLAGDYTIYPNYGDFTQACVFRTYGPWWRMAPSAPRPYSKTPNPTDLDCEDFIEVLFVERLYPVSIQIYETYNPGAIVRIMGCDYQGGTSVDTGRRSKWVTLWSSPVVETPQRVRIFSPPIKKVDTPINMIRLELNHSLMHYYTELDCIMLCGVRNRPALHDYPALRAEVVRLHTPAPPEDNKHEELVPAGSQDEEEALVKGLEVLKVDGVCRCPSEDDPELFEMLPSEVIQLIMAYLDFRSLGKVAQTCKLLQSHAYDPTLYTEVNLQPVWHLVNDGTLDGLSKRCERIQRLNLSWCGKGATLQNSTFGRFLQTYQMNESGSGLSGTLTCLQLSCCSFVNLETLKLISSHCPELKELDLSGCDVESTSCVYLMQLTHLERLNLYRSKIDTHAAVCIVRMLPELQHLNLGSCKLITNISDVVQALGQHCPKLRTLDLWRARNMQDNVFQAFIKACPLLEELDVGWCTDLNSRAGSFICIADSCKNLKKLFLTANRTVCDADLLSLARHSHCLQQLDILGTREVSSSAVAEVLSCCKEMVMFDVSFCAGITDADVAVWNEKFPAVSIKKSFQNSS